MEIFSSRKFLVLAWAACGVVAASLLGACVDSLEQTYGKCKMEGASKVVPGGGENAHIAAGFLYSEYLAGCMEAKGYKRNEGGYWIKP